mgnify:CR=1 FL=1
MNKRFNSDLSLICSLCGTFYHEEQGHSLSDCWGLLHQALLKADAESRSLRYKLQRVQRRIDEAKAEVK